MSLLLFLASLAPLLGAGKNTPAPTSDKVLVLDPIKIHGSPLISFAIDIAIYAQPNTKKVNRIFITRVVPGTDAEKAGLQEGDEIVKIDGVAVKDLDAVVSLETPLGRTFLNRRPGEPLKLEVMTRRPQQFTLRAQRSLPDIRP